MSLEDQVKRLADVIEANTAAIVSFTQTNAGVADAAPSQAFEEPAPAPAPAAPAPAPAPAPAAPAPAAPAPAPAPAQQLTTDQVNDRLIAKCTELMAAGKTQEQAMAAIVAQIGAPKITQVAPEQWPVIVAKVDALTAAQVQ